MTDERVKDPGRAAREVGDAGRLVPWAAAGLLILALFSWYSYIQPGPYKKDMQYVGWSQSHAFLGLGNTRGYNISAQWVNTPLKTDEGLRLYMSAPAGGTLLSALAYVLGGHDWRAMRAVPALTLALLVLFALYVFKKDYLAKVPPFAVLFALPPMVLVNLNLLDNYVFTGGLAILSYILFAGYLDKRRDSYLLGFAASFFAAFFVSYIAASIVPAIALHAFYLKWRKRMEWKELFKVGAAVAVPMAVVIAHVLLLPGAFEALKQSGMARAGLRTSAESASISVFSYVFKQGGRAFTYFTPISLLLSGIALIDVLRKSWKRAELSGREVALLHMATWGIPFGIMLVQGSYVHYYLMFYFTPFFVVGSFHGLEVLAGSFRKEERFKLAAAALTAVFLVFSVGRSYFKISGKDVFGRMAGMAATEKLDPASDNFFKHYPSKTVIPEHHWAWPPEDLERFEGKKISWKLVRKGEENAN